MSHEERWQLGGNAAAFYERYVMLIMQPWVRRLVDVAMLQPDEHVLDVACGTGFVARLAAQRVGVKGRVAGGRRVAAMMVAGKSEPNKRMKPTALRAAAYPRRWADH